MIRTCAACRHPNTHRNPFLCTACAWREWGRFAEAFRAGQPAPLAAAQVAFESPIQQTYQKRKPARKRKSA